MDNKENFEFIKETRKERPFNKRKFISKLTIAIVLAIVFGFLAALCFTIGMHWFNEALYPEKIEQVVIGEEEIEDAGWDEVVTDNLEEEEEVTSSETVINNIVEKVDISIADYEALFENMHQVAQESSKAIVSVRADDSIDDWFNEEIDSAESCSGLIFADNGKELLILVNSVIVDSNDVVNVEFSTGEVLEAAVKKIDSDLKLAVISIPLEKLTDQIKSNIEKATFGSSNVPAIEGKAIIAIGRPQGLKSAIEYGFITSNSDVEQLTDTDVKILTTDIYGSQNSSGVLINLRGKVIGIINNDFAENDSMSAVRALSISDIKPFIENMSNDKDRAMLGIKGMNVSQKANEEQGIPKGAYVTEIVMDSPAMIAGIQSGDVIVSIDDTEISSFDSFKSTISEKHPGDISRVKIKRFAQGEYKEVAFDITLDTIE